MCEVEFLGTKIMKCKTLQEVHDAKRGNMHVVTLWAALERAFQLGQLSNMAAPAEPSAGGDSELASAVRSCLEDMRHRVNVGINCEPEIDPDGTLVEPWGASHNVRLHTDLAAYQRPKPELS